MSKAEIKQGDIWFCNSNNDEIDSEQKMENRPVIILSNNSLNKNRKNVIVAPITKAIKKNILNHYPIHKSNYKELVYEDNIILLECIRDISKRRIERKMCELSQEDLDKILNLVIYDFIEFPY